MIKPRIRVLYYMCLFPEDYYNRMDRAAYEEYVQLLDQFFMVYNEEIDPDISMTQWIVDHRL